MSGDDAKKVKRANKREVEEAVDEAVDEAVSAITDENDDDNDNETEISRMHQGDQVTRTLSASWSEGKAMQS